MKYLFAFFCILLIFKPVSGYTDIQTSPNFLDNELADDHYIIIYIKLHNIPDENAKYYALVHAAELAHKKGYSFLTLDSVENVIITKSEAISRAAPRNIFQELIVEGDFRAGSIARGVDPKTQNVYKAIKIYVTFYNDEPKGKNVYEVCSLIFCK